LTYGGSADELSRGWGVLLQLVGVLHEEGVPILVGTDTGAPFLVPGRAVHEEMALLVECGLSPLDALRAATVNPARQLGVSDSLGRVAPGYVADLVILSGNPLNDIGNVSRIESVVLNGRLFSASELGTLTR
jgi:imidazolonepropionase-like amidohydrolase